MTHETIGRAEKSYGVITVEPGVAFEVPCGDDKYNILLSNEEMDSLLRNGIEKMLANTALSSFDLTIKLEAPYLSLFVGAKSIRTNPGSAGFHAVHMEVGVVSQSQVYEHRANLYAKRNAFDGNWSAEKYEVQPPLRDVRSV